MVTAVEHDNSFGPRKTVVILAIVAGCFAVLWPKLFSPMLMATYATPPAADSTGCCDVIFESDVTAVDIMQELCHNIIKHHQVDPRIRDAIEGKYGAKKLSPSGASLCREEVLARCGIDLSSFLADKGRSKKTYKQVLEEIRGFNGSLCLRMQFGVSSARLGTPHLIRYHILMPHSTIKQERATPQHAGNYHPALRERGRAIPSSHIVPKIQGRPDHLQPMMRPPMGAGGHVASTPKGGTTMGIVLPLYTVGIVIFFLYTLSKVLMGIFMPIYTIGNLLSLIYKALQLLRKSSDGEILKPEYSTAAAEKEYQKLVFNPESFVAAVNASSKAHWEKQDDKSGIITEEPISLIDDDEEHQTPKSNVLAAKVSPNLKESNVAEETADKELDELHETPTVKVVNMEMTASCEGGKRSRPSTPILMTPHSQIEEREKTPPVSIYLEGALPHQCELLVTDSETQEIMEDESVEVPIVLSGKMTLSLISLDQESQEDDQLDTTAAHNVKSEKQENSTDKLKQTGIRKQPYDEEPAKDSYESGSEESGEISDDDNLDSNTDTRNHQRPKSSKNLASNSDEEDSETDDYRHDYERNAALLETIKREKNRRLGQMKNEDSEEEEEEDGEDEEEDDNEDQDVDDQEVDEEYEEEDDGEENEELEDEEDVEGEDDEEYEEEQIEETETQEEYDEEEEEEEEEEEMSEEQEEEYEDEEEETDDGEMTKKSQEKPIENSKNATSPKDKK